MHLPYMAATQAIPREWVLSIHVPKTRHCIITMVLFYYTQADTTTVDLTESGESGSDFDVKTRTMKNADEILNSLVKSKVPI